MKVFFLFFILSFSFIAEGRSLLNVLEEDTGAFSIKKQLKKDLGSVFPDSLNPDSFVKAFESKNFKKALKIWNESIKGSDFSKSSTGSALYAYLLLKNRFEFLSLYTLFSSAQPKQINPIVRHLWKNQDSYPLWNFIYFLIDPDWQLLFKPELIAKVSAKSSFDLDKDHEFMKSLLSLPLSGEFDSFDLEWPFLLSFLKKGDKEAVGKLLSWFLSQEKYKDRKNKVYLTIGRLLADMEEYPAALSYYKKVEKLSYLTLLAQEEMSWIFLNQKKEDQALQTALALSHPGLELSPSMFFVLALSQFRNCDNQGAFQTLLRFKKAFSNKSLKYFFDKKDFDVLSKALLKYYQSDRNPLAVNAPVWPYLMRRDTQLKNQIFLYDYLDNKYKKSFSTEFKKLYKKQRALIQEVKKERDQRLTALLNREYQERQAFLNYFQILEAEILYQYYGRKLSPLSKNSEKLSFNKKAFYRSKGLFYFPFHREEIWLDELFDYKARKNISCLKSKHLLVKNKE